MSLDKINDSLRVAEQRSTIKREVKNFRVIGYNYTLNIDDDKGGFVTIFLRDNFSIGNEIIDNIKTGKRGVILRKEVIKDEAQRAK